MGWHIGNKKSFLCTNNIHQVSPQVPGLLLPVGGDFSEGAPKNIFKWWYLVKGMVYDHAMGVSSHANFFAVEGASRP